MSSAHPIFDQSCCWPVGPWNCCCESVSPLARACDDRCFGPPYPECLAAANAAAPAISPIPFPQHIAKINIEDRHAEPRDTFQFTSSRAAGPSFDRVRDPLAPSFPRLSEIPTTQDQDQAQAARIEKVYQIPVFMPRGMTMDVLA